MFLFVHKHWEFLLGWIKAYGVACYSRVAWQIEKAQLANFASQGGLNVCKFEE